MSGKDDPANPVAHDARPAEPMPAELQARIERLQRELDERTQNEQHYGLLFENTPIPYQSLDADGRFLEVNQAWLDTLGYERSEVVGRWFGDLLTPEQVPLFAERFPQFLERGHTRGAEFLLRRKDGGYLLASFTGRIGRNRDGSFRQTHCVFEDATQRRQAEAESQARAQTLQVIFENAPSIMALVTRDGRILDINRAGVAFAGRPKEELLGLLGGEVLQCLTALEGPGCGTREVCTNCPVRSRVVDAFRTGRPVHNGQGRMVVQQQGRVLSLNLLISTVPLKVRGDDVVLLTLVDVTEERQNEYERQILLDVLNLVQTPNSTHDLLREVTGRLQEWSGCQAVGIRLREGEDFPYYETRGFPAEFVQAENRLCALDEKGELLRNSRGDPVLECMCGNVLCGRFDPSLPFFTPGGSFWTNSTTALLASTGEADRQGRTRNRCHGEGYQSVALVPLRAMGRTFGLLQFCDPRKGLFDARQMALFERLAGDLALGLAQRHAAASLRESEAMYRALVAGLPDIVMRFDRQGRHLFASDNVEAVTGLRSERFLGKTHRQLGFAEADCRFWEEAIGHVFETGRPYETEFTFEGKRGLTIHNWRILPELDAHGRVQSAISISRDITAQRQAERRYQTLFQQMHDGFALHEVLCDPGGRPIDYRFLEVNPAFERLTGLSAADVVGRTVREVMPGIEARWIERYGQVALAGRPLHFEDYFPKLGRWYYVSAYCPQPGQFAVFFLDVTDRHEADAQRLEIERRLLHAQRLESLGVLAGGIAHDFNNLLTVILGQTHFALQRIPAGWPVRENLEEAVQAARRAADLTRQMLAYSGKGSFILEHVDMAALVEENAHLFRTVVPRTITMDLRLARDLPPIRADRGQLQQVVMNLITNAAEAIGGNPGTITLSARVEEVDQAVSSRAPALQNLPSGRHVCLEVTDTGCGMDEATRQRLFDPFFTTKFTGRGLGMSVVLGIVKGHQGAIEVDSAPGMGTTVRILLPASSVGADREARAPAPQAKAAVAPSGGLVLVVDDEPPVREMCCRMLESLGYEVLAAGDGQEALGIFREQADRIACVVLDLSMPRMDGRAALAELHRIRPGVKVLLFSGYGQTEATGYPAGQGPVGFLQKPFSLDDLEVAVQNAIGGSGAGSK